MAALHTTVLSRYICICFFFAYMHVGKRREQDAEALPASLEVRPVWL